MTIKEIIKSGNFTVVFLTPSKCTLISKKLSENEAIKWIDDGKPKHDVMVDDILDDLIKVLNIKVSG